jgi:hypothetical protein
LLVAFALRFSLFCFEYYFTSAWHYSRSWISNNMGTLLVFHLKLPRLVANMDAAVFATGTTIIPVGLIDTGIFSDEVR